MERLLAITLVFFSGLSSFAQSDTLVLQEVEVQSHALKEAFAVGTQQMEWDSSTLSSYGNAHLGALLSNESTAFIKDYGMGNLATSSVRGASSRHTKVLWNGFDVTNPMLGQADLSYFSLNTFDRVSFRPGNSATLHGGGTQGGTINLMNQTEFRSADEISLGVVAGNYGQFAQDVAVKSSQDKVSTGIVLSNRNDENTFRYVENGTIKNRENADVTSLSAMLNNAIQLGDHHTLSLHHWFQQNDRGIPTPLSVPDKGERLANQFLRNTAEYRYKGSNLQVRVAGAYFGEQLSYTDRTSGVYSLSRFNKTVAETEVKYASSLASQWLVGVQSTRDEAFTESYAQSRERYTHAVFLSLRQSLGKNVVINPSIRQEIVPGFRIPLTGGLGYEAWLWESFRLYGNASRNYRIPTFNDLYFGNVGNSTLRPENGWGAEQSADWSCKEFTITTTAFYNDYTDWIVWLPQSGTIWRPVNMDVLTAGLESAIKFHHKWSEHKVLHARVQMGHTKSLNARTEKQMIYVPEWNGSAAAGFQGKKFAIRYVQDMNGERFVTTDNERSLPAFYIGRLELSRRFNVQDGRLHAGITVHNIWNSEYQAIMNQPMPGRYLTVNIRLNFKTNTI